MHAVGNHTEESSEAKAENEEYTCEESLITEWITGSGGGGIGHADSVQFKVKNNRIRMSNC